MSSTLTTGVCVIVSAFILTIFSTILPYWTYVVMNEVTYHGGLWRTCTVYADRFDCINVTDVEGWFHAVQCLMVIGIVILFITMVSGCVFHNDESRRKFYLLSAFSSLLGGAVLATGVTVYAVENKVNRSSFSAGFYLSIISAGLSFLAAALLAVSRRRSEYIALEQ